MQDARQLIEAAYRDRGLLKESDHRQAVEWAVQELDQGRLRVAEKGEAGWTVNAWVKEAILLYFGLAQMKVHEVGPFEFYDKIPLKTNWSQTGVRVVPPGTARYGSFLEPGCILMPGYVNIGARVGEGTMVDTWATVGSCAQVGKHVHLSGGVGLGGVLEPPGATPVIVEDGAFIGSRCIVVEGAIVEEEAVLGANVVITASTSIVDVSGSEPIIHKGRVPARSVVIPGSMPKQFAAGTFHVPCALIIGKRTASTDRKTSLNQALRDFQVDV
ncbi:MAG: 2,3,4,5-tetrahydropyridine-2,6-dicarboxylate N-succinyltransferase [Vulcanimicrobiota bacterium]